jgi:hypothetical protein
MQLQKKEEEFFEMSITERNNVRGGGKNKKNVQKQTSIIHPTYAKAPKAIFVSIRM